LHDLFQSLSASYHHLIDWYQQSLQTGGYPYIVLLMAMESSIVPLPSELIIPPAVFLVMTHHSSMTPSGIALAAAIGSWVGASIMYWASRFGGRPLVARYGRYVLITPEKVEAAERWSEQFGSFGIFLSRMLPVVRHLIGIPAGIVGMHYGKFSLYTFLGSLFWCSVLTYVSFLAGKDESLMRGEIHEITLWGAGAAAVLCAAYYFLVYRLSRKRA
jgi:membrane protein DedA with SNARE-associated domain